MSLYQYGMYRWNWIEFQRCALHLPCNWIKRCILLHVSVISDRISLNQKHKLIEKVKKKMGKQSDLVACNVKITWWKFISFIQFKSQRRGHRFTVSMNQHTQNSWSTTSWMVLFFFETLTDERLDANRNYIVYFPMI